MPGELQPLAQNFQVVDANGFPTRYFIEWAQQRQIDIGAGITADEAQQLIDDWAAARQVIAGIGLSGGGNLSANRTLNLKNTTVAPATYGDATHSAQITVDQQGRITGAANVAITGGGGGGGTPTVRSSNIVSSSASSYTLPFPAGTIAGDVVYVFGGHAFGINAPAGWVVLNSTTGSNFQGSAFAKIMTAGDITTGSVTITTTGTFNGVFALVTVTTATQTGLRGAANAVQNSAGAASVPLSSPFALAADLVLCFIGTRAATNCTFAAGITSLQAINATNASGAVGSSTGAAGALGFNGTGLFAAAGTGYYTCVVPLRG